MQPENLIPGRAELSVSTRMHIIVQSTHHWQFVCQRRMAESKLYFLRVVLRVLQNMQTIVSSILCVYVCVFCQQNPIVQLSRLFWT